VISRPTFDRSAVDDFLRSEGLEWRSSPGATDAENLVEVAGRLCYLSFSGRQSPKTNAEYIRHLIAHGHESVLEHVSWSFLLTGVSRGFSHQMVRHRVGFAFSQLSQQYHDEQTARTVIPDALRRLPAAAARWREAVARSQEAYAELLELLEEAPGDLPPRERLRLVRSAARSVLPTATETKLAFSVNARALRHFLKVRGTIEGDEEMRLVAAAVLRSMEQEGPSLFADFRIERLADGLPVVRHRPHGG
jgi:thymidylate synthase (FAD)